MKKKENKGIGSHGISNRTVIGIICIVSALLICFGVAPVVNRISDGKVSIVRVVRQIEAGAVIGADDVAVVEVGRHNLPGGLVTKTEDVIGKCVKSDLYAGDYILKDKLTGTEKTAKDLLGNLGSGKKAISVTIPSFGNGFSGKLRTGDIVSIIVYDNTENRAFTPKELQYVKVITTTTSQGVDHEDVEDGTQPVTITFLVNAEQAELLSLYDKTGSLHVALEYRGDSETAAKYLAEQDKVPVLRRSRVPLWMRIAAFPFPFVSCTHSVWTANALLTAEWQPRKSWNSSKCASDTASALWSRVEPPRAKQRF